MGNCRPPNGVVGEASDLSSEVTDLLEDSLVFGVGIGVGEIVLEISILNLILGANLNAVVVFVGIS